jgi:hypothetical protein
VREGLRSSLLVRAPLTGLAALLLYACPVGAQEAQPPAASDDAGGETTPDGDGMRGLRWQLAPLRWGGTLGNLFRWSRAQDQPDRFEVVQVANIRAASYIWQPWFAQVSGGIGIVTGTQTVSGANVASGDGGGRSSSLTGHGNLALFPLSRFPFTAYFDVSDSRASSVLTSSAYTTSRFGMRQHYRPETGNHQFMASIDRSSLNSKTFGNDTVTSLNGSYTTAFSNQSVEVNAQQTQTTRSIGGEGSLFRNLTARHTLRTDTDLTVDSFASLSNTDIRYNSLGALNRNQARYLQANTFVTWRPELDWPVYVTGGGRYFAAFSNTNGGQLDSQSVSANIAATWSVSRNLSLAGAATLASVTASSGGSAGLITTQSASASYVGDPILFGDYSYFWNAGGTLTNQTGGASASGRAASLQAGHSLTRTLSLWEGAVSLNAGQNAYVSSSSQFGATMTLVHSGGLSYRVNPSDVLSGFASVTASDTRTSGVNATEYQNIYGQLNGQWQITPRSLFNANITLQWNRQGAVAGPLPGTTLRGQGGITAYGSASYLHSRAFGVPGLRYSAIYSVNTLRYDARLFGDVTAGRSQVGQSFEQKLEWRLGRLDMKLSTIFAEIDGKKNALIFFQTSRELGNF